MATAALGVSSIAVQGGRQRQPGAPCATSTDAGVVGDRRSRAKAPAAQSAPVPARTHTIAFSCAPAPPASCPTKAQPSRERPTAACDRERFYAKLFRRRWRHGDRTLRKPRRLDDPCDSLDRCLGPLWGKRGEGNGKFL